VYENKGQEKTPRGCLRMLTKINDLSVFLEMLMKTQGLSSKTRLQRECQNGVTRSSYPLFAGMSRSHQQFAGGTPTVPLCHTRRISALTLCPTPGMTRRRIRVRSKELPMTTPRPARPRGSGLNQVSYKCQSCRHPFVPLTSY
jgi:hypothetical protein